MFKKSVNNPASSIVIQLRIIVAVLSVFAAFNLLTIFRQTDGIIGDSRVVNFTGIVRGKTQRLVKLSLLQGQADRLASREQANTNPSDPNLAPIESAPQPAADLTADFTVSSEVQQNIDAFIPELDQIITGLINGDETLDLPRLRDQTFQADMAQLQQAWEELKADLENFLNNPSFEQQSRLLAASETYWDLTNKATFSAQ